MTADRRAALVERVAQMFCSQVDLECHDCKQEGGCWYTDTATAAIDLIRGETLEEAARVAEREGVYPELNIAAGGPEWYRHGKRIAAAIRTLKEKSNG